MTDYHRPLKLPANRHALIERAVAQSDGQMSVGGFASQLSNARGPTRPGAVSVVANAGVLTIARLVQFARTDARQTTEQYAKRVGIGTEELEKTEEASLVPEPRVLFALSETLKVSYQKLMTLAGHRQVRDEALEHEALRFAALSAPMDKLNKVEAQALHDMLRLLHE